MKEFVLPEQNFFASSTIKTPHLVHHDQRRSGATSSGNKTYSASSESRISVNADYHQGPWYATAKFWKRFSIFLSIVLSAASLISSAIASLSPQNENRLNGTDFYRVKFGTRLIRRSAESHGRRCEHHFYNALRSD